MASQRAGLQEFNQKLASVRAAPVDAHHYPDFGKMERDAKAELDERHRQAAARNRVEVDKSYVPKTAADYRGPGAAQLPHKAKNEATSTSQLSVPLGNNSDLLHGRRTFGKNTSDVCQSETNIRLTGAGSLFEKGKQSTFRGWTPGAF